LTKKEGVITLFNRLKELLATIEIQKVANNLFSWVLGTLYYEKNKTSEVRSTTLVTGVQLVAAGLVSTLIALFFGEWRTFTPDEISWEAWSGLVFLIFMGSIVAYLAFTWLVTVQPPALVSTHTYVNPVVAVAFGWLIADERISTMQLVALGIVLVGVVTTAVRGKSLPG
jgi:drug/metabolite transporter (DMT)-like permease